MRERAFLGHINLRGDAGASTFLRRTTEVLGVPIPVAPNTVAGTADRSVFWLGPAEWLIVCPGAEETTLAAELRRALTGQFVSVVEVGGGQTVLGLAGAGVRDVLAKGCPLDLHPRAFAVGRCAQSHLAKSPVLLRPVADGMEIVVRRSFADYLWQWLETVAR